MCNLFILLSLILLLISASYFEVQHDNPYCCCDEPGSRSITTGQIIRLGATRNLANNDRIQCYLPSQLEALWILYYVKLQTVLVCFTK